MVHKRLFGGSVFSYSFGGGGGGGGGGGFGGLGSEAMSEESNKGSLAYWWADEGVRDLILEQGKIRVESTFATLTSLNSRLASLGGLLFAGAALTTTIATNVDKLSGPPTFIASVAVVFFAAGGLASFVGLASGQSAFAGEAPSWWARDGLAALREKNVEDAKYWIAGHHEDAIISLSKAASRRGIALNVALVLGAIGGLLVPVAAGVAIIYPKDLKTPDPIELHLTINLEGPKSSVEPSGANNRAQSGAARTGAGASNVKAKGPGF
jgi:hypothetical protein